MTKWLYSLRLCSLWLYLLWQERGYDFLGVTKWLADQADVIPLTLTLTPALNLALALARAPTL